MKYKKPQVDKDRLEVNIELERQLFDAHTQLLIEAEKRNELEMNLFVLETALLEKGLV